MASEKPVQRKNSAEKVVNHTRIPNDSMIRDHYDVGAMIGQGNFGKVYSAIDKHDQSIKWAIKSINKEKAGSSALKLVEREVSILKRVNHPNIINLNEVIESPKRMYLVMELCNGGELADVLKERKVFSEEDTKCIIQQLASAIAYLHKNGIVHRDIKPENILISDNPLDPADRLHVKITDFGLSVVKGGVTPDSMMQDVCGTPIYMAPEILDNKAYSQQCDVWALGVIMYQLLCGYAPFRAKEEGALYDLIREAKLDFTGNVWSSVSEEAKNCIVGMLKVDPAHRLSAAEVQNHSWITGETRDVSQPANVLEMMKLWKDELKQEPSDEGSISNEPQANGLTSERPSGVVRVMSGSHCSRKMSSKPSGSGAGRAKSGAHVKSKSPENRTQFSRASTVSTMSNKSNAATHTKRIGTAKSHASTSGKRTDFQQADSKISQSAVAVASPTPKKSPAGKKSSPGNDATRHSVHKIVKK